MTPAPTNHPQPRITAIIPMYRAVPLVAEAIESIQAQTVPVSTIIAVDDGCPDGSADFVASRFPDVRVVRKEHGGLADTLNHGLDQVTTEFIAFLDHDDRWMPEKLERQMAAFVIHPELDLVFCQAQRFVSSEGRERFIDVLPGVAKSGGLFRSESFQRVGGFMEGHDFLDWYARAMEAGLKQRVLDDVLYQRRIHDQNLGVTGKQEQTRSYLATLKTMLERRRSLPK